MARLSRTQARLRASLRATMINHSSGSDNSQRDFGDYSSVTVDCASHLICTIVTSSPFVVREWLSSMRLHHAHRLHNSKLLVGVGVQWTPSYFTGYQNPPATIQLCIGHHCLIVQLSHAPRVPDTLRRFLTNPDITFVGVNNRRDNDLLMNYPRRHELCLSIPNLIDLVDVAEVKRGCSKVISMEDLADLELEIRVRKDLEVGRSDWDGYHLSDEQVEYACVDACVSFLLGKSLDAVSWNRYASGDSQDDEPYYYCY